MSDERRLGYHFAAIPDWVLKHPALSDNAIRVFGLMARFTEAWPSLAQLAKTQGCAVRTIQRSVRELEAVGALTVTPRFRENGSQTTSLYCLAGDTPLTETTPPPVTQESLPPVTQESPQEVEKVLERETPSPLTSERAESERPKDPARKLARAFCGWYRSRNGVDPPQPKGELGVAAVFKGCLGRGWTEADIKTCAKNVDGVLSLGAMAAARKRLERNGDIERVDADGHRAGWYSDEPVSANGSSP